MANRGLWKKEVREARFKFLVGFLLLAATALLITLSYDYTLKILESAPVPDFAREQVADLKDYEFWVWSQWFAKNLTQLGTGLALVFGAGLINSEVSRKTIQFLMSKPITRDRIFAVKFVTNLVMVMLIVVASTFVLYVTAVATGHGFPVIKLLSHVVMVSAGLGLIFSISTLFSTVFDRANLSFLSSGAVALSLGVPGFFDPIKEFSLYYQMASQSMFRGEGFPLLGFAVIITATGLVYRLAKKRITTRDF